MALEYREDDGQLVWVRNPFTGTVTYFTHLHRKRSGFVRQAQETLLRAAPVDRAVYREELRRELEAARRSCAFCPGNESHTPPEVLHVAADAVFPERRGDGWLIRAVTNLIPRIPECCTGGRNESYVVIEDPRHFADDAEGHEDLLYTALLPIEQFHALLAADVAVARLAYANTAVRAVLIRKNQGRESGASQPHVHNQVIGSDVPFAPCARECEVTAQQPRVWEEIIAFAGRRGFVVEARDGCVSYFSPFGTFPRSYDVVCVEDRVRAVDLPAARWRVFGGLLYNVLRALGPVPLDYEVHDGPGIPLHAHVNERHFAYSNIGGTLNLPSTLLAGRGPAPPHSAA